MKWKRVIEMILLGVIRKIEIRLGGRLITTWTLRPPNHLYVDIFCHEVAAVPKNLGVGVNFRPCSEGYFLSGCS